MSAVSECERYWSLALSIDLGRLKDRSADSTTDREDGKDERRISRER